MDERTARHARRITSADSGDAARYGNESNVQVDLAQIIDGLGYGPVETEHRTTGGAIDIYVPHRRVIIETKARGLVDDPTTPQAGTRESPYDQVKRYVHAEIRKELETFDWDDGNSAGGPWNAVVTDGRLWHAWSFEHRKNAPGSHAGRTETGDAATLEALLRRTFDAGKPGKPWVPLRPADLFRTHADHLAELYGRQPGESTRRTETKKKLWLDMLRVSGIAPHDRDTDRLFITHSLLIAIARLVSHGLSGQIDDWKPSLQNGFVAWVTDSRVGGEWARTLRETIAAHDWKRRRHDVLQSLYMDFVDAADRKVFGEYYTPNWLASWVVEEALDDDWLDNAVDAADVALDTQRPVNGIGVLDPTCGSGTFLYHAALRILDAPALKKLPAVRRSNITAALVHGLDIHPVAVEIARTNILRVLPAPPDTGESAIRIRMGDSLLADDDKLHLFDEEDSMRLVTPGSKEILLPMSFVRSPRFAADMERLVNAAAEKKPTPNALAARTPAEDLARLNTARDALEDAIDGEGDSVWTWYAINIAAPKLLRETKVNRIVANPPWVKLSEIQEKKRKRLMETFGKSRGLHAGGKHAPHTDIASYCIHETRDLYLADPKSDPAIWLVKKAAIRSGQWAAFRNAHEHALAQTVDLEDLQPFGGGDARRCCLLLDHRPLHRTEAAGVHVAAVRRSDDRTGKKEPRPGPYDVPHAARQRFRIEAVEAVPPTRTSAYLDDADRPAFRQGATIVPHVLTVAESVDPADEDGRSSVTTRQSTKNPWRAVRPQFVELPSDWLHMLLMSARMTAFAAGGNTAIAPVDGNGLLLAHDAITEEGWLLLDEIYRTHAGAGKGTPKNLLSQIDHQNKLSGQLPLRPDGTRRTVLHPKSADIMRAARVLTSSAIVGDSLYRYTAATEDEASYLTALLNTDALQHAYRSARESGRDFHLHVWRKVPIPRYDPHNGLHRDIAALCPVAEACATVVTERTRSTNQAKVSREIRRQLRDDGVMGALNEFAARLLPEHADRSVSKFE